jgi:hypothetical protein
MAQVPYTIGPIVYDTTLIRDIRSGSDNPNVTKISLSGSGSVERTFVAINSIRPQMNFVTGDIKNSLNTLGGIDGVGFSASELISYLKKMSDGGQVAAGSSHIKRTVAKGLLLPQSLNMPSGQEATLNYMLHMVSTDGVTSPYTQQTAQALPAGSDAAAEAYILGAVTLNGTQLEGVSDVTLNFGLTPWVLAGDGLIYPTFSCVTKRVLLFTITARDAETFVSWGLDGQAQSVTDSTIVLQDILEGGIRGSTPITMTIDEGMMHTDALSYSDGSPVENTILFEVAYDGTAAPVVFTGLS